MKARPPDWKVDFLLSHSQAGIYMDGWLKLHRSLLTSRQFQNEHELKIWIWLLCKAYSRDGFATIVTGRGKRTIPIKRGELIFGRISAAKQLAMDESMVYRIIQRFKEDGCISIQVNTQFSIISISKYNDFQRREDEEIIEIEEDRTGDEHAMNMQRTGNEQPSNTQRTAVEQPSNTIKKVLEGKEGEQGKEGFEGEEGKGFAPAVADASPSAILFPTIQPAEAGTTPSGSAAVSPSLTEVKRKAREDLLGRFLDIYSEWMVEEHAMKAKINGTGVNAGKSILDYFRTSIAALAKQNQTTLTEKEMEERILTGWKWFLGSYKKVEPFHQDAFLRLVDINSKFQILYKQAKNGTVKQQQQSSGNESKLRQAEGVVATIIGRNRGNGQSSAAGSGEAV